MTYEKNIVSSIRKRDGRIADFNQQKVSDAIIQAITAVAEDKTKDEVEKLSDEVVKILNQKFHHRSIPAVEEIQDIVEEVLITSKWIKIAKAYILYRDQHSKLRNIEALVNSDEIVEDYLQQLDWRVKENSNMAYSLQGLNNHISSAVSARYWLYKVYPEEIRDAHSEGIIHIHDLQILAPYCCGWELRELLIRGFGGVNSKIESKPPKHLRTALGQIVNFFYTLQGEVAGAQAFANFDTYLAPFIRYDDLSYTDVKQCMQEFLFNVNVPTRVGFQCMSEDTEILSKNGWKKHNAIKKGDIIATFNLEKECIEYLPVKNIFAEKYNGKMYNLKNRISDQLISPEHRVVRKPFYSNKYILEKIENIMEFKAPFITPIGSEGYIKGAIDTDENIIKLIAWIVAEGSIDKNGRGTGRISIYQSKEKSSTCYEEIVSLCKSLQLKYTERIQKGLGANCNVIRFDSNSNKKILKYFKSNKQKGIKFIPDIILKADTETARLFLETYIKGDGHEGVKITTASEIIKNGLLQVIVHAGYGATVAVRKPEGLSKKDRYIIRIIKHKDTYINNVQEINYKGVIWCPNTQNETVIARRNGKIFITGNTPFTNLTMDLTPSKIVGDEAVIIGGEAQKEKYKDFQKEMDMINNAFCDVMMQGDSKGRVFTFPIPTYNITKKIDWNSSVLDKVFEMTAKYGIPYFSNFINSDMDPDDARSMCCRLRLDNKELRKRGGGLFAANPLTGSIGVVTINLPRLGYLSKNKNIKKAKEEFFARLGKVMDIAKESLEIKRKILEKLTDEGLYPYARYYLAGIKSRFGTYWKNHFSTIGTIGMNEALLNLMEKNIAEDEGKKFAIEIMDFMLAKTAQYQAETNNLYNLESVPGEGTTYRLAKIDKKQYPDIITANESKVKEANGNPYYTNSTHLPVAHTKDIFEALKHQDAIQTKYTGGTVFHGYIGEKMPSKEATKNLVKKIAMNFHLPYFTITPTFSICPKHGYIAGEHFYCPICDEENVV